MKNTFGNNVTVTLFGESHGKATGAVLDGIAPGIKVDEEFIAHRMNLRRGANALSTARREADKVEIISGVFNGKTTGTPITFIIRNENTRSEDYGETANIARPGHADYTGFCKYHGYNDYRGGGHFSGRITAGLVAAGSVAMSALSEKGIIIGTHIARCAGVEDKGFSSSVQEEISFLNSTDFAVLDEKSGEEMKKKILDARSEGDSVGGILETVAFGVPSGVGEPFFDSIESEISHILFSIPGIKGVEFGDGFALADMLGSQSNDSITVNNGKISCETNHMGGIFGGISSGDIIRIRTAVKPTPSIYKSQNTVDFSKNEKTVLNIKGRHDPAIIHRCRAVVDACVALALCDLLTARYGTEWWCEK